MMSSRSDTRVLQPHITAW